MLWYCKFNTNNIGRQERALCLILASIFGPSFSQSHHKPVFGALLKRIFEFEATGFIEELLSNLLKEQLAEDGLSINNTQVQKVID